LFADLPHGPIVPEIIPYLVCRSSAIRSFRVLDILIIHVTSTRSFHHARTDHLNGSRSLLFWQRSESEIWLDDSELREEGLGLVVLDAGVDNHIITRDPVDWGGDAVLVTGLKGVDDTENLGGVTASGSRVREDEADGLLGVDNEDRSDGESDTLGVDVGGVLVVEPFLVLAWGLVFGKIETHMS
jgi:hypothetical protein